MPSLAPTPWTTSHSISHLCFSSREYPEPMHSLQHPLHEPHLTLSPTYPSASANVLSPMPSLAPTLWATSHSTPHFTLSSSCAQLLCKYLLRPTAPIGRRFIALFTRLRQSSPSAPPDYASAARQMHLTKPVHPVSRTWRRQCSPSVVSIACET